jgi:hypothetical protein
MWHMGLAYTPASTSCFRVLALDPEATDSRLTDHNAVRAPAGVAAAGRAVDAAFSTV